LRRERIWKKRPLRRKYVHPAGLWSSRGRRHAAEPVMALFPPQRRDWALPSECALTPRAAERLAREAAAHSEAEVADALRRDWGGSLDGKQVQRWANTFGSRLAAERDAEVMASESGRRPSPPANAVELLGVCRIKCLRHGLNTLFS